MRNALIAPLLIAVQFLTRLPAPAPSRYEPGLVGRSLLYYPWVGAGIGALLWAAAVHPLGGIDAPLAGIVLLLLWVGITGVLHLDGLADSADGWVGGRGSRERTLEIMKEPAAGPAAVTVLVLTLLLKYAALVSLLRAGVVWPLVVVPVLGRGALLALFLTTPYVRPGGLGERLCREMPRPGARWTLAVLLFATAAAGPPGVVMLLAAGLVVLWARAAMVRRLGGATGDTAGALVELVEGAVLLSAALYMQG